MKQLFEFCILEVCYITTDLWTSSCIDAYMVFTNVIQPIVLVKQAEEIDLWLGNIWPSAFNIDFKWILTWNSIQPNKKTKTNKSNSHIIIKIQKINKIHDILTTYTWSDQV